MECNFCCSLSEMLTISKETGLPLSSASGNKSSSVLSDTSVSPWLALLHDTCTKELLPGAEKIVIEFKDKLDETMQVSFLSIFILYYYK